MREKRLFGWIRRKQLLDDLRNIRRYWEIKPKIEKVRKDSLSHENNEEIQAIFLKSMDLLTISTLNDDIMRGSSADQSLDGLTTSRMALNVWE